jgi:hypothetical protein
VAVVAGRGVVRTVMAALVRDPRDTGDEAAVGDDVDDTAACDEAGGDEAVGDVDDTAACDEAVGRDDTAGRDDPGADAAEHAAAHSMAAARTGSTRRRTSVSVAHGERG